MQIHTLKTAHTNLILQVRAVARSLRNFLLQVRRVIRCPLRGQLHVICFSDVRPQPRTYVHASMSLRPFLRPARLPLYLVKPSSD